MPWTLLIVAGVFEVGWAIGLKYPEAFTRPMPTALTVLSMIFSLGLLGLGVDRRRRGRHCGARRRAFRRPRHLRPARLHRAHCRRHRRPEARLMKFGFPRRALWSKHLEIGTEAGGTSEMSV